MSRQRSARIVAALAASALLCAVITVVAGPQEKLPEPIPSGPSTEKGEPKAKGFPAPTPPKKDQVEAGIDKMIEAYDLKPHPVPPIPDNPPPHEGALIDLPYFVEPPDLILVEVLEALPGRPISGERLVRSDGKISLGFYGEIHVRGLTVPQIKVAIIKHLRKILDDETLGLMSSPSQDEAEPAAVAQPPGALKPAVPELPKGDESPVEKEEPKQKSRPAPDRPGANPHTTKTRPAPRRPARPRGERLAVRLVRARRTSAESRDQEASPPERNQLKIDAGGKGRVTITIDIDGQNRPAAEAAQPALPPGAKYGGPWQIVPLDENDRVLIDVTAYNSKNYYVLGDVLMPGRLPWTGNETVLDALQFAGGFLPTAEPKDIHLVRPARGGKPARVYKVDLEAIQQRGDITSNYQLFPGDRLIIGRNEVIKKTTELDRLNAPLQAIVGSMLQTAFTLRAMQFADPNDPGRLYRDLLDFWAKELSRKGDLKLDEQTLREALLRQLKRAPSSDEKR